MSVTVGGHHLKDTVINGEKRDIESATTQVKHQDVLLSISLVQTVGNSSCGSKTRQNYTALAYFCTSQQQTFS